MSNYYTIKALTAHYMVLDDDDRAFGINTVGHVVGGYRYTDKTRAYIYNGTTVCDVDLTVTGTSIAYDINDVEQVVGAYIPEGSTYSTAFFHDGLRTYLFDSAESRAIAINQVGQVLIEASSDHNYLWTDGQITPLGTLGGKRVQVSGLNAHGSVVGWSQRVDRSGRAFLYQDGVMKDLGCLDIPSARRQGSTAFGINDHGDVVGFSGANNGFGHACLWTNQQLYDLGAPNGMRSTARAINNTGYIVGYVYTYPIKPGKDYMSRAVLWHDKDLYELNHLIDRPDWHLSKAIDINEKGQIIGWGILEDTVRAFLLTPD